MTTAKLRKNGVTTVFHFAIKLYVNGVFYNLAKISAIFIDIVIPSGRLWLVPARRPTAKSQPRTTQPYTDKARGRVCVHLCLSVAKK